MIVPVVTASGAVRLVVGLGNPEQRYWQTRHNVGAVLVERIVPGAVFRLESKLHSYCCRHEQLLLVKPNVSMNHSGRAVSAVARYYRIAPTEILVVHDELDLAPGVARFKFSGGAGGHNGVNDVVGALQSKDFYRLRLGIGHPGDSALVDDFVLSGPTTAERALIDTATERALGVLPVALEGMWEMAMNRLHAAA